MIAAYDVYKITLVSGQKLKLQANFEVKQIFYSSAPHFNH